MTEKKSRGEKERGVIKWKKSGGRKGDKTEQIREEERRRKKVKTQGGRREEEGGGI